MYVNFRTILSYGNTSIFKYLVNWCLRYTCSSKICLFSTIITTSLSSSSSALLESLSKWICLNISFWCLPTQRSEWEAMILIRNDCPHVGHETFRSTTVLWSVVIVLLLFLLLLATDKLDEKYCCSHRFQIYCSNFLYLLLPCALL